MAQIIAMPKFGQTAEESTLVKWHKKEGDVIRKGEVIFEIETDKAVLEVESFQEGTLLKILVREGETVPFQAPVAFIGTPGEPLPAIPAPAAPAAKAPAPAPAPVATPAAAPAAARPEPAAAAPAAPRPSPSAPAPAPAAPAGRVFASPRARALAERTAVDVSRIRGSGPDGRIVERDVRAYLDAAGYDRLKVSPAARNLARREKIDLTTVRGTGDGGRVMVRDIERAMAERPRVMSRMRQVIAQRLTQSFTSIPHFYVTVGADMTGLLAYRQELKARAVDLSVTDFILEAVVLALQEMPVVNSWTDGRSVRWNSSVHLGMAVALDDGLVVPVIRDAQDLGMSEVHEAVQDLATRAREGKLKPDEMSGSTFTVSNMGMLGVDEFSAIINPGEAAILAVASTQPTPVVRDGKVVVRSIMRMTLSADHRIIDGAQAARFVNAIKSKLEDVDLWKSLT